MKSLREYLEEFGSQGKAMGHFNFSETATFRAIVEAAREAGLPVLVGVSEGEREFVGVRESAALVRSLREEGLPIFLNADHTHSLDKVKEAAEAGFDEILFDGSKLPFEENVAQTKQAVEIVKSINPDIIVEGEIGYIGSSSELVTERPKLEMSTPDEARRFVDATGVDVLAPAVGNMHGMLKAAEGAAPEYQKLDIPLIAEIKKACGIFMTLHGGSGSTDADFEAAHKAGMTIIHISTELRVAWRKSIEETMLKMPDEIAPYKLFALPVEQIKKIVSGRMRLFST